MKRIVIIVSLLIIITTALSSCQKCTVCTAQTASGDVVTEYCGTELDVRDFEKFFVDSIAGVPVAGYCERGPN